MSETGNARASSTVPSSTAPEIHSELTSESDAWDRFLQTSRPDIGYKQFSWWGDLLASRNWGQFVVMIRDAGGLPIGGARVYVRYFAKHRCYYHIPDGPVLPADPNAAEQVFAATMERIDEHRQADPCRVSHLRIEPRWQTQPNFVSRFRATSMCNEPRDTLCIDLDLSPDEILQQMKPKGRYNVRLAGKKGVTVVEDNSPQGLADFVGLYKETVQRQQIDAHSRNYFATLTELLFARDRGSLMFAQYEGIRLAGMLMIRCGDYATYKYGGTRLSHRSVMAPYRLHFEAMLDAKARGHKWYDFYGVAPADQPDDRWADFSAFKRKFGGRELHFGPALDHPYHRDAYREYREYRK
ncbi:FemAB family protein [Novipirellula galeiformis]|uniref:FemAB family protein n=2 Tax=Novipirellula galeiformis TaxID=2528004 RepID=A0A5C6BZE0_9BACT|nr:FemAB family protein [Novipirellula galeiformis]